jgi:hypothetical protein
VLNGILLLHQKALAKGNRNRATLVVARKMVAWLLAVDRENRKFIRAEQRVCRQLIWCPEGDLNPHDR